MDVPLIDENSLERGIETVLSAARGDEWIRKALTHPEAAKTYGALDAELFVLGGSAARVLAVTSAGRGDGRTTMALLLAVYAAALERGRKVLLVDADIDRGRLGQSLGLPEGRPGLAELFAGVATPGECIHPTALANLSLAPVSAGARKAPIFSAHPFEQLIDFARERFDLVVIDSPAGSANKAALSIAKVARQAIVVVRYGATTREQVESLTAGLKRAGTDILGCVLNQREYVVPRLFYGAS
jgi:tyrosine-protein kinase Etk/Wzc